MCDTALADGIHFAVNGKHEFLVISLSSDLVCAFWKADMGAAFLAIMVVSTM